MLPSNWTSRFLDKLIHVINQRSLHTFTKPLLFQWTVSGVSGLRGVRVTGHATLASILGRGHVTRLHQSTAAHLVQGRRLKATFATFFRVKSA